jgi:chaperonin GroES
MIVPLRDFVVVSKEAEDERTSPGSLLYRPQTAEAKIVRGTVKAVGSGRVTGDGNVVPLEVKEGDRVVFNRNFATEITEGAETFLLLREDQLLCVVK